MSKTITGNTIKIEVSKGCLECPFSRENDCGCDKTVRPTHDYTYPAKCPLLDRTIIVARITK